MKRSDILSFKNGVLRFRLTLLVVVLGVSFSVFGQNNSVKPLTEPQFLELVRIGHPVVMRSNLFSEEAKGKLREARGAFDPELYGELSQKNFDDREYYSLLQSGIRVPTWFGVTLDAGLENNRGVQLNPEGLTPSPELWYAGISVSIGQGLFIDERRAELRKAKAFMEQNEAERKLLVNEIMLDASTAYWKWYGAYFGVRIAQEVLFNSEQRLDGVVLSAIRGDKPYIDTLEATIQVQNRMANRMTATLELLNHQLYLETFLWKDGIVPLVLSPESFPQELRLNDFSAISYGTILRLDSIGDVHPKLMSYRSEIQMKELDLKLKREYLKPKIDLKYNALSSSVNRSELLSNYTLNNYNWGVKVALPLFLRKERGGLKLAQVKVEDLTYKLADEIAQVNYRARTALNNLENSREQVELFEQTVENYKKLYESEVFLFEIGESSLFLVNSREKSWLNAQIKLLELKTKNQVSKAELNFNLAVYN